MLTIHNYICLAGSTACVVYAYVMMTLGTWLA
jgi:hypothetical protein